MEIVLNEHFKVISAGLQYILTKDERTIASGPRRAIMEALTNEGPVLPPDRMVAVENLPEVPGF